MAAEPPSTRIARLLTLVPWLSARPGITLDETAAHFGIDVPTLERDLWQVILCGVPGYGPDQLVDIDFWDDGAIYVHDPQTLTAPLRLGPEESAALLLGLHALAQTPGVDQGSVASAAAKIEGALTGSAIHPRVLPGAVVPAGLRAVLDTAIADHGAVEIEYASADGTVTIRTVWPTDVISIDGVAYITGWCERAEAVRTFRIDRIARADPVDGGSPPGPVESVAWWENLAQHRALVRVPSDQRWILEEAADVVVERESGGVVSASVGFAQATWVTAWVVRHPGAIVVEGPSWVRDMVRDHAESLLRSPALRAG